MYYTCSVWTSRNSPREIAVHSYFCESKIAASSFRLLQTLYPELFANQLSTFLCMRESLLFGNGPDTVEGATTRVIRIDVLLSGVIPERSCNSLLSPYASAVLLSQD